jgi:POT family proton-dependent oligopeptide transporter
MLGAIIADQYLGRYNVILLFSFVYLIGWIILTCTSIPSAIEAGAGFPGYVVSLVVIGCKNESQLRLVSAGFECKLLFITLD